MQAISTDDLVITREDTHGESSEKHDTLIRISFRMDNYQYVVAVKRKWHSIGKAYRTEIHWHQRATGLIAAAELYAIAMCKAVEIAKELNTEGPTDLAFAAAKGR